MDHEYVVMTTYEEPMAHGVSIMKFRELEVYLETLYIAAPFRSDALRRIKISRAQMLESGRSSPSMVGMSSETVG